MDTVSLWYDFDPILKIIVTIIKQNVIKWIQFQEVISSRLLNKQEDKTRLSQDRFPISSMELLFATEQQSVSWEMSLLWVSRH